MRKELEKVFGKARDMVIAEIVKQVGEGEEIKLNNRTYFSFDPTEGVIVEKFKRMYKKDGVVYVEADKCNNLYDGDKRACSWELWELSADELFEVIEGINK